MVLLEQQSGKFNVYGSRSTDKGLPDFVLGKLVFTWDSELVNPQDILLFGHILDETEQAWIINYRNNFGNVRVEEWVRVG